METENLIPTEEIERAIAIVETHRSPESKKETFLVLAALNLLNAAVKKPHHGKASYGFIKVRALVLLEHLIKHSHDALVEKIYYDTQNKCAYFRCYGMLLSFHGVYGVHSTLKDFASSRENVPIVWDGVHKQTIASELMKAAEKNYSEKMDISGEIVRLTNLARKRSVAVKLKRKRRKDKPFKGNGK